MRHAHDRAVDGGAHHRELALVLGDPHADLRTVHAHPREPPQVPKLPRASLSFALAEESCARPELT